MSENKKQHYVPQFYLKNFSVDGKQIVIYHPDSKKTRLSPISSTCQDKFFYGKDLKFEEFLSKFEPKQAEVLKKIIDTQNVEILSPDEFASLLSFIMLQFTRTKDAKLMADNFVELFVQQFIKPIMKGNAELMKSVSPGYIDSLKITNPEFYKLTMGTALTMIEGLSDLKVFLVINKTKQPFISSDSPVVKNNYYKIKQRSLTGFQSPGLQIICPLTDTLLLLFIHDVAYKIDKSRDSVIEIIDESDVNAFNSLQILNNLQILFIIDQKYTSCIQALERNAETIKMGKRFEIETVTTLNKPDGSYSEIVSMHAEGVNYSIRLSFLAMNHDYNRKLQGQYKRKSKTSPVVNPCRSDELVERMGSQAKHFHDLIKSKGSKQNTS
jgi:hypothetical protein